MDIPEIENKIEVAVCIVWYIVTRTNTTINHITHAKVYYISQWCNKASVEKMTYRNTKQTHLPLPTIDVSIYISIRCLIECNRNEHKYISSRDIKIPARYHGTAHKQVLVYHQQHISALRCKDIVCCAGQQWSIYKGWKLMTSNKLSVHMTQW